MIHKNQKRAELRSKKIKFFVTEEMSSNKWNTRQQRTQDEGLEGIERCKGTKEYETKKKLNWLLDLKNLESRIIWVRKTRKD